MFVLFYFLLVTVIFDGTSGHVYFLSAIRRSENKFDS